MKPNLESKNQNPIQSEAHSNYEDIISEYIISEDIISEDIISEDII